MFKLYSSDFQCHYKGIRSVSGQFQNGLPNGRVIISYQDGENLEGNAHLGVLEGKVRLFSLDGQLSFVGIYENGVPHGPAWLLPTNKLEEEGAVLVHYSHGKIDHDVNVVHLGPKNTRMGSLVNQTYIQWYQKLKIDKVGEMHCLKV